jgi:hypothetical protein
MTEHEGMDIRLSGQVEWDYEERVYLRNQGRPRKDFPFTVPILAFDVGGTWGYCFATPYKLVLGWAKLGDDYLKTVKFIRWACRRFWKTEVFGVESGYCPSYDAVMAAGVCVGALGFIHDGRPIYLVPPHRKPSFTKGKTEQMCRETERYLGQWYQIEEGDLVPFSKWRHAVSAVGVALTVAEQLRGG